MAVDPALIAQARQLLNRARVIAEAPAAQLGPIGRRHPGSTLLVSRGRSTLETLHTRLTAAVGSGQDRAVRDAIDFAERELRLLTHGPPREGETPQQRKARILLEYEGRHYADVADLERIHKTYVWKIRINSAFDGVYGRKVS